MNQATLLGRVGKIDSKTTTTGIKLVNLSLVTSKKYEKNGEKQEKVTWHNVTVFSRLAEIAEKYVGVGDLILIQGEIDNQKYKGQDGQEKTRSIVIGHDIKLFPKSKELKPAAPAQKVESDAAFVDDDIPW